jgi:RNA recognition motif-containing protein
LQAVADGIENMGSELKTRIPEMERHLASAQRTIPEDIGTKMQTALSAFESQVQNLAQIVQQASDASGVAAERVRQADLRSTEQMLNGLGEMAHEFEDFGKTLFAAFEAEFGRRSNGGEANVTDPVAANQDASPAQSQAQEETHSSANADLPQESVSKASEAAVMAAPAVACHRPVPPAPLPFDPRDQLPPHLRKSLLSELKTATSPVLLSDTKSKFVQHNQPEPQVALSTPRESFLSEIRSRATPQTSLLPEIISRATQQDSLHPEIKSRVNQQESLSSEIRSRAMQNTQSQITTQQGTENPLFSSWPNRPAFVLPPKPAVAKPQAVDVSQNTRSFHSWVPSQPPFIPTTTRPPVPPKAINDKPTLHTDAQPAALSDTSDERSEDTSTSLFMGNIGFEVTERVIEEVFASHLFSAKVHLPIDSSTGKHAGFGYAHFPSVSSAKAALGRLQGVVIDGHSLNLEYCDNSPIDDLQTQARPAVASNDSLPSVFSGNARSTNSRVSRPTFAQGSSSNPFDHPEETPEFAARYPSLLPTFKSQGNSLAVPARSMTLSPNSEMARFPPVSQIDAHLLANNQRRDLTETSQGRSAAHGASGLQREETGRAGEEYRMRKPRRVASTIHRGSAHQLDTQSGNAHSLRRRATEANSLRRRTYENPFRDPRPVSLYDRPTGSIPGSFPVDDAPAPVTNNDELNNVENGEVQYAMRQSLIDQCVDHLLKLGYGTYIDGGRDRLRIIAEAADLQVSDAIDMIEEERTAYERYTPNA